MITREATEHIAEIAHLHFAGGELDAMTLQMRKMADFALHISEAEAALPADSFTGESAENAHRPLEREAVPASREALLAAAADERDGFLRLEGRTVG